MDPGCQDTEQRAVMPHGRAEWFQEGRCGGLQRGQGRGECPWRAIEAVTKEESLC